MDSSSFLSPHLTAGGQTALFLCSEDFGEGSKESSANLSKVDAASPLGVSKGDDLSSAVTRLDRIKKTISAPSRKKSIVGLQESKVEKGSILGNSPPALEIPSACDTNGAFYFVEESGYSFSEFSLAKGDSNDDRRYSSTLEDSLHRAQGLPSFIKTIVTTDRSRDRSGTEEKQTLSPIQRSSVTSPHHSYPPPKERDDTSPIRTLTEDIRALMVSDAMKRSPRPLSSGDMVSGHTGVTMGLPNFDE